jgi:hypothetical protein
MPMAKSSVARALAEPQPSPSDSACGAADALLRAAAECARQHERLGRSLERACSDVELQHIAELTTLSDTHLQAMTVAYETTATAAPEAKDEAWWHAANALWHASREYARRNAGTNHVSRLAGKHSKEKLSELAMEYELERSALMAVKRAVAEYKAVRKDVE